MTFKPKPYQLSELPTDIRKMTFTVTVTKLQLLGMIGKQLYLFLFVVNDKMHLYVEDKNLGRFRDTLAFTDYEDKEHPELITRSIAYWIEKQAPWDDIEHGHYETL